MIRAMIFDLDGVLVQTEKLKARAYALAVQQTGYDVSVVYLALPINNDNISAIDRRFQAFQLQKAGDGTRTRDTLLGRQGRRFAPV